MNSSGFKIDTKALLEFRKLYRNEYGVLLSKQEALECGERLIRLVKAVYGHQLPKRVDLPKNEANN